MQISPKNNHPQKGVTLLELLVSLMLLSLALGISAIWLAGSLPSLAVKSSLSILETDLKQARLRARTTGAPVILVATASGYRIDSLAISREWQRGIRAKWNIPLPFSFGNRGSGSGGTIEIHKGKAYGKIIIDPYTGKLAKN